MMSKFKVGDRVRVKSGISSQFVREGDEFTVDHVNPRSIEFRLDGELCSYMIDAFELVTPTPTKAANAMTIDDLLEARNTADSAVSAAQESISDATRNLSIAKEAALRAQSRVLSFNAYDTDGYRILPPEQTP